MSRKRDNYKARKGTTIRREWQPKLLEGKMTVKGGAENKLRRKFGIQKTGKITTLQ